MAEPREMGRRIIDAVVVELATVLHSRLGTAVSAAPSDEGQPWHWIVTCRVHGAWTGHLRLGLGEADAAGVTAGMREPETAADDDALAVALREVVGQATAVAVQRAELVGLRIDVETIAPGAPAPADVPAVFRFQVGDAPHSLAMWCEPQGPEAEAAAEATTPAVAAADVVEPEPGPVAMDTAERQPAPADAERAMAGSPGDAGPGNLEVILDIDLPISVRFGQTEMTLDALVKLAPGSLIDLARSPDDPVDLLVNGVPIARGEVVVVSGNYGLRVAEVVSPADRLRSVRR